MGRQRTAIDEEGPRREGRSEERTMGRQRTAIDAHRTLFVPTFSTRPFLVDGRPLPSHRTLFALLPSRRGRSSSMAVRCLPIVRSSTMGRQRTAIDEERPRRERRSAKSVRWEGSGRPYRLPHDNFSSVYRIFTPSMVKIQCTELKLSCGNDAVVKNSIYINGDHDL
jgi:hypothetical protein